MCVGIFYCMCVFYVCGSVYVGMCIYCMYVCLNVGVYYVYVLCMWGVVRGKDVLHEVECALAPLGNNAQG